MAPRHPLEKGKGVDGEPKGGGMDKDGEKVSKMGEVSRKVRTRKVRTKVKANRLSLKLSPYRIRPPTLFRTRSLGALARTKPSTISVLRQRRRTLARTRKIVQFGA